MITKHQIKQPLNNCLYSNTLIEGVPGPGNFNDRWSVYSLPLNREYINIITIKKSQRIFADPKLHCQSNILFGIQNFDNLEDLEYLHILIKGTDNYAEKYQYPHIWYSTEEHLVDNKQEMQMYCRSFISLNPSGHSVDVYEKIFKVPFYPRTL